MKKFLCRVYESVDDENIFGKISKFDWKKVSGSNGLNTLWETL